jgi:predicted membrane-bound dolichyl-phosphate-mannose-protein mannosyltransferase
MGLMSRGRQDIWISMALFVLFVGITLPGIGWGAPNFWHPDELAKHADKQLSGSFKMDGTYFNHPFLPQNAMLAVGKVVYGLGYSRSTFILIVRLINAMLAGGIVILAYGMARLLGGGTLAALLSAGLVISSSEIALNARIAHDDIPLAFFTTLSVLLLIQFQNTGKTHWLYLTFFSVGLAASCKYNAVSLLVVPLFVILWEHRIEFGERDFRPVRTIILGIGLTILGFGLSSPQVFLHFRFFMQVIGETMRHHAEFNASPGGEIGLLGQWKTLLDMLGAPVFITCWLAVVCRLAGFFWAGPGVAENRVRRYQTAAVMLSILALDLPMLVVRNYPARFFVPLIPLLSVLVGLMIEDLYLLFKRKSSKVLYSEVLGLSLIVIVFSLLRVVSITLLYLNDARIAASSYVSRLPASSTIEYTFYPPSIPNHYFKRKSNYPLFFPKSLVQGIPDVETAPDINSGEAGLEKRKPDIFVVDSFTLDRFKDPLICQQVPAECAFFQRLMAGETHYRLEKTFQYQLPDYLPRLEPFFLNPTILIFQRTGK